MTTKSYLACLILLAPTALTLPAAALSQAASPATGYPAVVAQKVSKQTEMQNKQLASLEVQMFAHPYAKNDIPSRVQRLERFVLGTTRDGLALQERVSLLVSDVQNVRKIAAAAVPEKGAGVGTRSAFKSARTVAKTIDPALHTRYPHVTELEQAICHQSFENESVKQRLDRMEKIAFDKVSTSADMAKRVDALDWFAFSAPPVRTADRFEFEFSQRSPSYRHYPEITNVSTGSSVEQAPQPTMPHFVSVVDEIEYLERTSFGKISANKPLEKRVIALEKHVYGAMQTSSSEALSLRVAQLWASVITGNSSATNRSGV